MLSYSPKPTVYLAVHVGFMKERNGAFAQEQQDAVMRIMNMYTYVLEYGKLKFNRKPISQLCDECEYLLTDLHNMIT